MFKSVQLAMLLPFALWLYLLGRWLGAMSYVINRSTAKATKPPDEASH